MGPKPKGPWLLDLHRWLGGLAVLFTAAHVGALIADSYVAFDLVDVLVPFAAEWQPGAVAWGVVALWLLLAIEVTSLLMRRIPKRVWRAVHLSSYGLAVMATLHGVTAGTDVGHPAVAWTVLGDDRGRHLLRGLPAGGTRQRGRATPGPPRRLGCVG